MRVSQLQNLNGRYHSDGMKDGKILYFNQNLHDSLHHNITSAIFFWPLKFLRTDQSLAPLRKSEIIKEYRRHVSHKKWRTARKIEANEFIGPNIVMEKDT